MKEPLLTIVIPTYNRADVLSRTLEALFSNPDYDADKIEVVVSDNASTDHTAEVAGRYPQVRYFRNETNIGPNRNFTVSLSRGHGKYLRLMNDTGSFGEGMLGVILREIEAADPTKENLYFTNKLPFKTRTADVVEGKDEFIGAVSYFITWSVNFGIWRTDFERLEDKNRFVDTLLHQVDWTLCMVENGRKTKLFSDMFIHIEDVKNKGTYDVFNVFVTYYLSILKFHKIGCIRMKVEKYRLFRHYLLPKLTENNEYTLDMSNKAVVFRRYWYEPYFFPLFLIHSLRSRK
jgi:glycosyltransferase involved in cell wall biosynthesis